MKYITFLQTKASAVQVQTMCFPIPKDILGNLCVLFF